VKPKRSTSDSEYQEFVKQVFEEAQNIPRATIYTWTVTDQEWNFRVNLDLFPLAGTSIWLAPDLEEIHETAKRSLKDSYWKFLLNIDRFKRIRVPCEEEKELAIPPVSECRHCSMILGCRANSASAEVDGPVGEGGAADLTAEQLYDFIYVATEVLGYHENDIAILFGISTERVLSISRVHASELSEKPSEDLLAYYRSTPMWRQIRVEAIKISPACKRCGSEENLHVHHKVYGEAFRCRGTLYKDKLENLEVLCRSCHYLEHREAIESKRINAESHQHSGETDLQD